MTTSPPSRSPGTPGSDGADASRGTILVVEDESALRRLVTRMLRRMGFETLEAKDGREGLALARTAGSDLDMILSDVVMPELSGPDMAEMLRGDGFAVPVAFMSGYSGEELSGADRHTHFLAKPFTMGELGDFVSSVLEERNGP